MVRLAGRVRGSAAGFPEPVITCDESRLWVSFAFSDAYLNFLEGAGARAADRGTAEVTPYVTPYVTPHVAALIRLIGVAGELASPDLLRHLGLRDRKHMRERYLTPCLDGGWIAMTIPDKPKSRDQRYRLTTKGRDMLAILNHESGPSE